MEHPEKQPPTIESEKGPHSPEQMTLEEEIIEFSKRDDISPEAREGLIALALKVGRTEKRVLTDELTGLYNRTGFINALEQLQKENARKERDELKYSTLESVDVIPYSIIALDLDGFKAVNDTFSHSAGDECLKMIAEEVGKVIRATDVLAREGGDEFLILLPGVDAENSKQVAQKVFDAITRNVTRRLQEMYPTSSGVSASIGIINFNHEFVEDTTLNKDDIVLYADYVRYVVKAAGKQGIFTLSDARSVDPNKELWNAYVASHSRN